MQVCPYCRLRAANSDEHIFPAFLGGNATIRACRECNSHFGSSFEGKACKGLAPSFLALMLNGLAQPREQIHWSEAFKDEAGIWYDLLPGLRLRPSRLTLVPLETGGHRIVSRDSKTAKKVAAGLTKAGRGKYESEPIRHVRELSVGALRWTIPVDDDLRRLAVKMCIALSAKFSLTGYLENSDVRTWLIGQGPPPDIRYSLGVNPVIQNTERPSHYVRVEGDPERRTLLGAVCFLELVTLYVPLNLDYSGERCSISGRLDMIDLHEEFRYSEPQGLHVPSKKILRFSGALELLRSRQRLDRLVEKQFGSVKCRIAPSWIEAKMLLGI